MADEKSKRQLKDLRRPAGEHPKTGSKVVLDMWDDEIIRDSARKKRDLSRMFRSVGFPVKNVYRGGDARVAKQFKLPHNSDLVVMEIELPQDDTESLQLVEEIQLLMMRNELLEDIKHIEGRSGKYRFCRFLVKIGEGFIG